jgi:hypothetical protein
MLNCFRMHYFLALVLSISFYHGLTTAKYVANDGTTMKFDYPSYLQTIGDYGIHRTRVFADLPWYWRYDLPRVIPIFKGRWAVLPFSFIAHEKTWDFETPNPEFVNRMFAAGEEASRQRMQILLCFTTQGPDLKCPYFQRMGYASARSYYQNADDISHRESGAWDRFLNHFRQVAAPTTPFRRQYVFYEPFNEQTFVESSNELRRIRQNVRELRGRYQMQLNVPNPLFPVPGFSSAADYLAALHRILEDPVLRISRLSFHNIYTADGVHRLAVLLRSSGISPSICEISTDGATPWKGRFTEESYAGDKEARRFWNGSISSVNAVIEAHREILQAARSEKFAVCDFQDLIKWNGELNQSKKEIKRFYRAIAN